MRAPALVATLFRLVHRLVLLAGALQLLNRSRKGIVGGMGLAVAVISMVAELMKS